MTESEVATHPCCQEKAVDDLNDLRMEAYFYGFTPTGVREVDLILCAVASAGKAFHYTIDWNEPSEYGNCVGATPKEWIQNAANSAAEALAACRASPSILRSRT